MTTAEHFERLRWLFVGASEQPRESRRTWLESQCADNVELVREIEDLLERSEAAETASTVHGGTTASVAFSELMRAADPHAHPRRIGGYEILHVIGSGRMGAL